jgi:erythromycin esterase-like protein
MWRNIEMHAFVTWLQDWNAGKPAPLRAIVD